VQKKRTIRGVTARARIIDRVGRYLISIGGIGIIAAVMGILLFILFEAYPLFRSPDLSKAAAHSAPPALVIGMDPYHAIAYIASAEGVDFMRLQDGEIEKRERPAALVGGRAVSASRSLRDGRLAWGLDDGRVLLSRINFRLDYSSGERAVQPQFSEGDLVVLDPRGEAVQLLAFQDEGEGRSAVAGVSSTGRVLLTLREQEQGLLGAGKLVEASYDLTADIAAAPRAVLLDRRLRRLLVGMDNGHIGEWKLADVDERPQYQGSFAASNAAITALEHILGDVSIIVGDAEGHLFTWAKVEEDGRRTFAQMHELKGHADAVVKLAASLRDKQFLSADASGHIALHHMTSEQTFFSIETNGPVGDLAIAPKADGFVYIGKDGRLSHYKIDNPHPEITLGVLFGKVWYEGYGAAEFVWQSTGGTDEFESKISLIPLLFGTVKGTFYAMLFALPLAVMAAIYTAEFASPRVRSVVKPTVEVMASLPSVILGFLAGLWLAPLLETRLVGTLLLFPLVPICAVLGAWCWQQLPADLVRRATSRWEIYLLVGITLLSTWLAFVLGPTFEQMAFAGSFLHWLRDDLGMAYDQRNSLVVGFAMGFAVVPLIFTICEDALSSIPSHLRAGSLALGATRWQTAVRVVLPMALPGIFSASMIGFGRAIGETMIVLMATGNTPVMDWNIFNGMRTISANIAVELPEAPHEGTLYRVLFLSGLLLFMATFSINTLAEIVRQRLRDKYSRL
jgi:phosphate transport system permease protein